MRLIVIFVMVSFWLVAQAGEDRERERLSADLPRIARDLADASQLMTAALQRMNLAPPPAVLAVAETGRARVQEMQRMVADPAKPLTAAQAEKFREEAESLRHRLGEIYTLADTLAASARYWPQCVGTPELARYQALIRTRLDGALSEMAAGVKDRKDDGAYSRLSRRHTIVLGMMEAGRTSAERWRRLPADAPVLRQYHEQRQAVQTLAENGLEQKEWSDDRELDRQQSIFNLLGERVALVQVREERLGSKNRPADAPAVMALKACQAAEDEVLQAMITHLGLPHAEDAASNRKDQELRQQGQLCHRMTGFAWDWLGMADQMQETQQRLQDRLRDTPPVVREEMAVAQAKLDQQRTVAEQALIEALAARVLLDAVQAKSELWVVQRGYEQADEDLSLRLRLAGQEHEFKTQAATATAALKRLAVARTAYIAARDQQRELEQTAIRTKVARDLADVAAEESQRAVERGRTVVSRLRDELERVQETANTPEVPATIPATKADGNPGF